jgi:DNA-binding transcriptional ArsR family regulator
MGNQTTASAALDALGDPTRRLIIERLSHGALAVGELSEALPVGRPAVSKQLKVLEGAGLVQHRSVGTRNLYALAPGGLDVVQRWLVAQWDEVLGSFADHIERNSS